MSEPPESTDEATGKATGEGKKAGEDSAAATVFAVVVLCLLAWVGWTLLRPVFDTSYEVHCSTTSTDLDCSGHF